MNDYSEETSDMEDDHPTQAQLYDDLRRIGQLEDQKHTIQAEIEERTNRLRAALKHLDQGSLLYQMLSSALAPTPAKAPRKVVKKAAPKKRSRK